MAIDSGVAGSLDQALELTPAQIMGMDAALSRLHGGGQSGGAASPGPGRRWGTREELAAALLGAGR